MNTKILAVVEAPIPLPHPIIVTQVDDESVDEVSHERLPVCLWGPLSRGHGFPSLALLVRGVYRREAK